YEEWLAAGNSGSEQDFLDALVGPAGQDGVDGASVTVTDNGNGTITVSDGINDVVVSDGADGVVDPKDLTAGDSSITVTDGTGATIVDTNIIVAEGGITTDKLADDAVTGLKIDDAVAGTGLVKNETTNTFDVQANNGLNVDATADAIQLGGTLIKPTTVTTDATQTLAIEGLQTGTVDNALVAVEADGTLRQIKAAMPKFFYMPAVIFDTSVNGTFTRNLHTEYQAQFTGTANPTLVSSAGAVNAIPTLPANELEYHITYYDTAVFSNLSIDANGVLSYTIIGSATEASYMTIVFVVK
ncbi:hypothetical protein ITJ86_16625, partial [Winogradskyella sp. F6397]|nr:hypothetical protein [Winogradskyella marina]